MKWKSLIEWERITRFCEYFLRNIHITVTPNLIKAITYYLYRIKLEENIYLNKKRNFLKSQFSLGWYYLNSLGKGVSWAELLILNVQILSDVNCWVSADLGNTLISHLHLMRFQHSAGDYEMKDISRVLQTISCYCNSTNS